jgi:hypothetical protein
MEVREGTALSRAMVQAESIREAVNITRRRYPGCDVRVMFPIDPEDFFLEGPAQGDSRTPETGASSGSWTTATPPRRFTANRPAVPSLRAPVKTTPTTREP